MDMWVTHEISRLAHMSAERSLSGIVNIRWIWPYLVATVLLFGVFTPMLWWYSYHRAQARLVADSRLIRWVYIMHLVGIEVAGVPAFLSFSVDPDSLSAKDVLAGQLTLLALAVGLIILFLSIWLEWRAKRQGRWQGRA